MKRFLTAVLILVTSLFLFVFQRQIQAAPPAEQYSFQNTDTILGNGGEFADTVTFKGRFNGVGSRYSTQRKPRLGNCYLPHLEIRITNAEGDQGRQVAADLIGDDTSGDRMCNNDKILQFIDKPVTINTDNRTADPPPPNPDDPNVRVVIVDVRVKTTAKSNDEVPNDAKTDDITLKTRAPMLPVNKNEKVAGNLVSGATIESEVVYSVVFKDNLPGTYTACSRVAKQCVDFEKKDLELARVSIRNDSLTIEGTDSDDKPPAPPEPPCAKKNAAGECEQFSTALGSFATDPGKFVASVFAILLAASGAIALILIMRAGYKIMTSQGKPDTIQEGREQLIAAVVGLLFLIFSLVFLEVIGVDILQIPGAKGNVQEGGQCDAGSNSQCAPGLTCESQGGTKGGICTKPRQFGVNCDSCETQEACTGRGGKSIGILDCTGGTICCE